MSGGLKALVIVLAAFAVAIAGSMTLVAATLVADGLLVVDVRETGWHGDRVSIAVPASLVRLALWSAEVAIEPGLRLADDPELRRLGPFLEAVIAEFEHLPDAVLLEARDGDEQITIAKRGGALLVHVDSPRGHVRVRVPGSVFSMVWSRLGLRA